LDLKLHDFSIQRSLQKLYASTKNYIPKYVKYAPLSDVNITLDLATLLKLKFQIELRYLLNWKVTAFPKGKGIPLRIQSHVRNVGEPRKLRLKPLADKQNE